VRRFLPLLPLLAALVAAGSAPASGAPPRLLGLAVSNGGHPFAGDTRELATVSPNGDGLRDHAYFHFRLLRPAIVQTQVVATDEVRRPGTVVWRIQQRLKAGAHVIEWTPKRRIAARTYLVRFVVRGLHGGKRVYGFEPPRAHQLTSGLVVRILGIEASLPQRSYPQGGPATISISTDSPSIRLQVFAYAGTGARDPNTNAVAITPSVRLDWRKNRNAPHLVEVGGGSNWASGLYFLRATASDGRVAYAPLILRPRHLGEHRIAVVLPTNTWQAYNFRDGNGDGWGDSWYIGGATRQFDLRRPYVEPGLPYRFHDWSSTVATWLSQNESQVDYLSDDDLDAVATGDELRHAYGLVVFAGHEEYVTSHMYDVVQRYRDLGGNLMFLSANNFFWKVTKKGSILRRIQMWRKLGRPEAALVGVQWVAGNQGQNEKPYVVASGLPPQYSQLFGGLGAGSTFGGSGVEIDARAPSSPASTVVLARIPGAIGSHDAEMTIYGPGRPQVFAAGTLDFTASLGSPAVSQILRNVWKLLAPQP
jgi:N,N-dimethylformamidase beta subunit-like protein